jgi:hypothetical protein
VAGGLVSPRVKKLNKLDLSLLAEGDAYASVIYALVQDANYVYVGVANPRVVKKLHKFDLAEAASSPDYGGVVLALAQDDGFIYQGGDLNFYESTYTVRKLRKSDLTQVAESPDYGGIIRALAEDADEPVGPGPVKGTNLADRLISDRAI